MKCRRFAALAMLILIFYAMLAACASDTSSGDWVNYNGNDKGVFSDEGYYYLSASGFLYFLDVDNGINVCLCSKIACPHDSDRDNPAFDTCEAYIKTGSNFSAFFWEGGLYYIASDYYGYHLYRRNADGTAEQQIMTLCQEYIEEKKSVMISKYYFVDGILYYGAVISDVVTEGNTSVGVEEKEILKRVDLRTRTEEEILSEPAEMSIDVRAVRSDRIIYTKMKMPQDSSDEDRRENLLAAKVQLIHLDLNTGESRILLEKTWGEVLSVKAVTGDTVLYETTEKGQAVCRRLDLKTGKDSLAYAMQGLACINEDYGLRWDEESESYILVDVKTGENLPTEFAGQSLYVQRASDEGVVIMRSVRGEGSSVKTRIYSYFTFESLKDGLQEEDAIDFYIRRKA